jgi:hypothetical protein
LGLSRKIQAIDSNTPGRINGTTAIGTKIFRSGVLVRSVSQASMVPKTNVRMAEPEPNIRELTKVE